MRHREGATTWNIEDEWRVEKRPLWVRSRCYHLCPMCQGHAPDHCRHIEVELSLTDVFWSRCRFVSILLPQGISRLIAACRCNNGKHTDQVSGKDPVMR